MIFMSAVKMQILFLSHPKFVDLIRVGDDFFEIDDVLMSQPRQDLHLAKGSLTIGLKKSVCQTLSRIVCTSYLS